MTKSNRRNNGKASHGDLELGIGPSQRSLDLSTESRYLRAAALPKRLRQKPAKASHPHPA